ncbi:MAG: YihY/virulence factor BrkB family protein [Acetatifactor sp.]|nr:YihY/virulence factor BrkB family protein [Lachnospiraceae bacterium]MDE5950378.1 YihY/virulence factor BrkB family protein [Acetatifactor sp.]
MIRKLIKIGMNFNIKMSEKNISAYAASTAFFIFLSLVPMLMVICTMIPYTPLTEENLTKAITEVTPNQIDPMVTELIRDVYQRASTILPLAAIIMIWTAAKGLLALMRGLNAVNDVQERRNYFVVRFVAALYTVVMLIATVISLVIMVLGSKLVDVVLAKIPQLEVLFSLIVNLRFIFSWVVLTLLFAVIYTYVPSKKLRFREQIPGASFTAVVWSVFSWGFSIYLNLSGSFSIYGSLSLIIIAMIWMYFCMYIILVGAYLNNFFNPVNKVLVDRRGRQLESLEE